MVDMCPAPVVFPQPAPPELRGGVEEVHAVVVGDLRAAPDGLAGHQHHPRPLPVLHRVGVAGVVEEGRAAVHRVADGLHGEGLSPPDDGLHDAVDIELENLNR